MPESAVAARSALARLGSLPGLIHHRPSERTALARIRTGLISFDRLLGGGLPRGVLVEIVGTECSGRTSLAYAILAATTAAGEYVAYVDLPDAFDPEHACEGGVELARVLWVRPR